MMVSQWTIPQRERPRLPEKRNRVAQVICGASCDIIIMSFTIRVNCEISQGSSIF